MHRPVNDTALTVLMQDLGHPLANADFIPSHLATATEATQSIPSPGPTVVSSSTVSATVTAEPPSLTAVATGTRFVETVQVGTSTQIATDVRRAETTPVPLFTGLVRNKPSIWGSKGFYILLGVLYLTLLCLFLKQIISSFERQP